MQSVLILHEPAALPLSHVDTSVGDVKMRIVRCFCIIYSARPWPAPLIACIRKQVLHQHFKVLTHDTWSRRASAFSLLIIICKAHTSMQRTQRSSSFFFFFYTVAQFTWCSCNLNIYALTWIVHRHHAKEDGACLHFFFFFCMHTPTQRLEE